MLEEFRTDRKLIELYKVMTNSDFAGNTADTYIIEVLYALMNTDLVNGDEKVIGKDPLQLLRFAKEVVRLFETEQKTASCFSMANWAKALCHYMKHDSLSYKDIHRMSTIPLRNEVRNYLNTEDE